MNPTIKHLFLSTKSSIKQTMQCITLAAQHGAPVGLALVVDSDEHLLGIVTDGDIRRAILKEIDINSSVDQIMVKSPITVPPGLSDDEMLKLVTDKVKTSGRIRDFKVQHILVVNEQNQVLNVLDFFDLWKDSDVKNKSICVFGLGFVGLTLGVSLADVGFKVYGYDINEQVVDLINQGAPQFYEKGLASLLKFHTLKSNFEGIKSIKKGQSDIYIISVGTPIDKDNKPNLYFLDRACQELGSNLKKNDLVILRSTVPLGTTRNKVIPNLEKYSSLIAGEDFFIAFAPERTVEGKALEELRSLPQVIGGFNKKSADLAANFFSSLNNMIIRVSSLETAEMIKLANNSFRDLSFAFSNEMTLVCDKHDLDVVEVINAANEGYPRNHIPVPSPGVGGVCLKKDPYLYAYTASQVNIEPVLPFFSRKINEAMPRYVFEKIKTFISANKENQKDIKIFLIGFAFKGEPETSDMRDSPTLELLKIIEHESQWKISGYDPVITREEIEKLGIKGTSLREGFLQADCVLILNNHRSYRDMDILGLVETMNKKAYLFDGWHLFPKEEFQRLDGIIYGGLSGKN